LSRIYSLGSIRAAADFHGAVERIGDGVQVAFIKDSLLGTAKMACDTYGIG
jgi:hypothetical protein